MSRIRIRWEPAPRLPRVGWAPVALLGIWGALVLVKVALGAPGTTCLFKNLTRVPCPTCGGTRAALELFRGDPLGAWLANPLLFTVGLVFGVLLVIRLIRARWPVCTVDRSIRPILWITAVAALAANWAFLIASGR